MGKRIDINGTQIDQDVLSRAQGCFLGQCIGDALGQLVEFQTKERILQTYPEGVRDMHDGGTFNTLAGQPTDDTEMALMLARAIIREGRYDSGKAFESYRFWFDSDPLDCGNTIASAMYGSPSPLSQANGAMMRLSPLGIFGSRFGLDQAAEWAMEDTKLTHPNEICVKSSALYVMTIAEAISTGLPGNQLYENTMARAKKGSPYYEKSVLAALTKAAEGPPEDFSHKAGWVVVALQNAYYRLLHEKNLEAAIIDTVNSGGDTDTNAAICGALLGAVYGLKAIPARWANAVLNCRPSGNNSNVAHPRQECFWPVDILQLSEDLLSVK